MKKYKVAGLVVLVGAAAGAGCWFLWGENVLKEPPAVVELDVSRGDERVGKEAREGTAARPSQEEMTRMPTKERVRQLIENLAGGMEMRMSGPSHDGYTLWDASALNNPGRNAVDDLVAEGLEAFELLIEACDDPRSSQIEDLEAISTEKKRRLTVGELVQIAAMRIARKNFSDPKEGTPREQMSRWWGQVRDKGLKEVLAAATEKGDKEAVGQAMLLAEKFPREALEPIKRGFRKAYLNWVRWKFDNALRLLARVEVEAWLQKEMTEAPTLEQRVIGAQMWMKMRFDRQEAVAAMIREWKKLGPDEDEQGVWRLVRSLRSFGGIEGIEALGDGLMKRPVRVRWQATSEFYGGDDVFFNTMRGRISQQEQEQRARLQRAHERLLVMALEDDGRILGEEFYVDDRFFKLRQPRIGDMAAYQLARGNPKYRFNVKGSVRERDADRIAMVNVWRKEQGLAEIVLLKKPLVVPADEKVLGPLLARAAEGDEGSRAEALREIQNIGLGALAGVEKTLAQMPETHVGKAGMEKVAQSLANTVREVEISEKYGKLDAHTRELIYGFKGHELTGDQLAGAVRQAAIGMAPGQIAVAIDVEADSREAGLSVGVRIWNSSRKSGKFKISSAIVADGQQKNPQDVEVPVAAAGEPEAYVAIAKAMDKALQNGRSGSLFIVVSGYVVQEIIEQGELDTW